MPFSRGQHRGIDIAASEGTVVRSACRGQVRFAGSVAGSDGIVSVACGRLAASYLHLGSITVRAGADIGTGEQIGSVGRRSRLYLSARRTGDRFGYVDPLSLLRETGSPIPLVPRFSARRPPVTPPLGPAPRPVPVWHGSPVRPPEPGRVPVAEPRQVPAAHPQPASQPLVAWAGLGLLAAALPSWGVRRVRRRRRPVRVVKAGLRAG
ncbi:MAG: M23 family metallopeptidase [Actinomycetota bacterium]|nr:M23 family metallopeptidase [Actinomycetota bacterium]